MKLKDIIHLKENEPDKFWSAFYEQALDDYMSPSSEFSNLQDYAYLDSIADFKQKRASLVPYPYHRLHIPMDVKPEELTYVIQWFAMSDYDYDLYPVVTGLVPFPNSSYYTFHLHADGDSPLSNGLDVFTPHFFARYAERAHRLETDLPLPNTLHFTKQKEDCLDPSQKDFQKFAKFIGKFFGRNKLNRLCDNLDSVIADDEKDKNQLVCLWCDGLSFCVPYAERKVLLHKTFVSYADLKDSQIDSVAPELFKHILACCERFPSQYGSVEEFAKQFKDYTKKNISK